MFLADYMYGKRNSEEKETNINRNELILNNKHQFRCCIERGWWLFKVMIHQICRLVSEICELAIALASNRILQVEQLIE